MIEFAAWSRRLLMHGAQPMDIAEWRDRLLSRVLLVVLVLGTTIALPSGWYAYREGLWTVPVVDLLALAWVAVLWRLPGLSFRFRSLSVLLLLYVVGIWFLLTIGLVSQIYLLAFPVMTALLLGQRAALWALLLNAVSLVVLGLVVHPRFPVEGLQSLQPGQWLLITANFLFVDALITVSCATLLRGLDSALQRQKAISDSLGQEQARLRSVNEALRLSSAALARLNDMVLITNGPPFAADGPHIVFVNEAVERNTGYLAAELIGQSPHLFHGPQTDPQELQRVDAALQEGRPVRSQTLETRRSGEVFWQEVDITPLHDADGRCSHLVWVKRDITERKAAEKALQDSEDRWKLALESTGDGVWDWYPQTGVEIFSRRFKEMYGYGDDELGSRFEDMDALTHPDDRAQMARDREDHFAGRTPTYVNEHRVRCRDGQWKWILSRGMVISRDEQGRPLRVIGTHTDISNRKQSEALIWQQANLDALTGLPNRRMLRDRLEQDIARARRNNTVLAVLFIDLDHFKEVNDTLGHDQGDQLLVEAARRIQATVRAADTVARMGGDEFTVVLVDLKPPAQVEPVAQAIIAALAAPFQLGTDQAFVSASIGITLYPDDAEQIEALLKHADQALYVAKDSGRNRYSHFTPALQAAAQTRVRLANDLRGALAGGQLHLVFQPIVNLGNGAVYKAEALLRWQHPQLGPVSPAEFVPIAESSGLIHEIGDWVFREAADQSLRWRKALHPAFQISVNRSPLQFRPDLASHQTWAGHLQAQGLPGDCIAVEVTEGLLLDDNTGAGEQLVALRQAGMSVSLDDFGTGYSALSYLQRFEIDFLKIDQVFVRGLGRDSKNIALCKAIIRMAHELGMKVVAEGVETEAQRQLLAEAGCDYGQGYLFARPMPAAQLPGWLAEWESQRGRR